MSVFAEFSASTGWSPLDWPLADRTDVSVEFERAVPTGVGTHHLWVTGEDRAPFVDGLRDGAPGEATVLDRTPDRTLLRVDWSPLSVPLLEALDATDARLLDLRGGPRGWSLTLRFPDGDAVLSFVEACRERSVAVELERVYGDGDIDDSGPDHGLTRTQSETLRVAFETGYFAVPRLISLAELAGMLGVSEQAVSERLRRGLSASLTPTVARGEAGTSEPSDSTGGAGGEPTD